MDHIFSFFLSKLNLNITIGICPYFFQKGHYIVEHAFYFFLGALVAGSSMLNNNTNERVQGLKHFVGF
jgi:hypothetical protein